MQLILLSSGAVTIRPATLALATSALLPGKLAPSVRPLGSTAVSVRMHVAMPGAAPGTGVQVPLLPRISLTIGELTVTGARTPGPIGMTMSGAVSVTVIEVDWPTLIDDGEIARLRLVASGTTVSVALTSVTV